MVWGGGARWTLHPRASFLLISLALLCSKLRCSQRANILRGTPSGCLHGRSAKTERRPCDSVTTKKWDIQSYRQYLTLFLPEARDFEYSMCKHAFCTLTPFPAPRSFPLSRLVFDLHNKQKNPPRDIRHGRDRQNRKSQTRIPRSHTSPPGPSPAHAASVKPCWGDCIESRGTTKRLKNRSQVSVEKQVLWVDCIVCLLGGCRSVAHG